MTHFPVRLVSSLVLTLALVAGSALAGPLAPEDVWAKGETAVSRFIEKDSKKLETVPAGEKLRVVHREGDRVRVRLTGSVFGWVDASAVTDKDPSGSGASAP